MKQQWRRLADKIDALNLRERLLVFIMAALLLVTLINTVALDPLRAAQKNLSQQVIQRQGKVTALQAQIQAVLETSQHDPDAQNRARLERLKQQLAQSDATLQGLQHGLVAPDKMAGLLRDIIGKNQRLQLVNMTTLPASSLMASAETKSAGGASTAVTPSDAQLYKHGVEITVLGSYPDLMNYLAELEKLPWQMFWGKVSLEVEGYPKARLVLTLYTLSLDKIWLSV